MAVGLNIGLLLLGIAMNSPMMTVLGFMSGSLCFLGYKIRSKK